MGLIEFLTDHGLDPPMAILMTVIFVKLFFPTFFDRAADYLRPRRRHNADKYRGDASTGNPNGVSAFAKRCEVLEKIFQKFKEDQEVEWGRQRKRDGEMHEKINTVDRSVARLEGQLRGPSGDTRP